MARRSPITEKQIEQLYESGFGQGSRSSYKPWLTVRKVPSRGLSSRLKSLFCDRNHQLLSKLERHVLYLLESLPDVWDIREQYPLDRTRTLLIADQIGVRHPIYPKTNIPTVMTTDFLVTFRRGSRKWEVAIAAKYIKDAEKPRVRKKLEIEQYYWTSLPTPVRHFIITEEQVFIPYVENLQIMRPYRSLESLYPLSSRDIKAIARLLKPDILRRKRSLADACALVDSRLGYRVGTCLKVCRYLIANKEWPVDLTKSYNPRLPLPLSTSAEIPLIRHLSVA